MVSKTAKNNSCKQSLRGTGLKWHFLLNPYQVGGLNHPLWWVYLWQNHFKSYSTPILPPFVLKEGRYRCIAIPIYTYLDVSRYVCICIYIYSFSINVSDSIIVCEPKMTGWKWKPGTVANEKHSISEFDGLLFCYSIWLKFFFQINLSAVKQTKKIIFVFLFCIKNKSIFPVKELGEEKPSKWSPRCTRDLEAFKITLFSCLQPKTSLLFVMISTTALWRYLSVHNYTF